MRGLVIGFLVLSATAGWGDEGPWVPMSGEEIRETLTGRTLQYQSATQDFRASGRTLYNAGRDSWGYWRIQEDQYCSQWPPSNLWACYRIEQRGEVLRFVGEQGDVTDAVYCQ